MSIRISSAMVDRASRRRRHGAFTLVEVMMSSAIAVIIFGSVLVTYSVQQRSFVAALYQMDSQADENRVMGYLSRDLRNASAIQVQAGGTQVTLTIPAPTSYSLNLNLGLPLLSLLSPPSSSSASTTIEYYRQGTSILREVNGVATSLSSSATQFSITASGSLAQVNLAFQAQFSQGLNTLPPPQVQVTTFVFLQNAGQL